jgi:hypothetical protein
MAEIMARIIPISDVTKNITCEITLTGMKSWKVRLFIGTFLFRLAAWAIGMKGIVMVGGTELGRME